MDINTMLAETEKKWLDDLYGYVRKLFIDDPIPSHDQDHHLRVWRYATELIQEMARVGKVVVPGDAEDLMVACFFHDTGLVRENGPDHGKASRKICEEYLKSTGKQVHDR